MVHAEARGAVLCAHRPMDGKDKNDIFCPKFLAFFLDCETPLDVIGRTKEAEKISVKILTHTISLGRS